MARPLRRSQAEPGGDQGKCGPANHALGTEPDQHANRLGFNTIYLRGACTDTTNCLRGEHPLARPQPGARWIGNTSRLTARTPHARVEYGCPLRPAVDRREGEPAGVQQYRCRLAASSAKPSPRAINLLAEIGKF